VEPNYAIIYKSNELFLRNHVSKQDVINVFFLASEFVEDRGSMISVAMMQLPQEKLVRRVVKSNLDYLS
jgi:hypothetical protein